MLNFKAKKQFTNFFSDKKQKDNYEALTFMFFLSTAHVFSFAVHSS